MSVETDSLSTTRQHLALLELMTVHMLQTLEVARRALHRGERETVDELRALVAETNQRLEHLGPES